MAIVVFRGDASGIAVEEARGSSWQSFLSPLLLGAAESFDARVVVDSAFPRQNPKAAPIRAAIRSATSTTMAPANAKSNARRWDTVRARKTNGLRTYARSLSIPRVDLRTQMCQVCQVCQVCQLCQVCQVCQVCARCAKCAKCAMCVLCVSSVLRDYVRMSSVPCVPKDAMCARRRGFAFDLATDCVRGQRQLVSVLRH